MSKNRQILNKKAGTLEHNFYCKTSLEESSNGKNNSWIEENPYLNKSTKNEQASRSIESKEIKIRQYNFETDSPDIMKSTTETNPMVLA